MKLLVSVVLLFAFAILPNSVIAGYEIVVEDVTLEANASSVSLDMTLGKCNVKSGYAYIPALDDTDTATISMVQSYVVTGTTTATIAPLGWSNVSVGADEDGALKNLFEAETNIFCDGISVFTVDTLTTQAADRTVRFMLLLKY